MKQKFISLALAVMLLLGVTGCAMSTPASVGSIGGVDIPAGIYLLAQYNAYNTASGAAKLATGETASNVKAVLKAECTGTINGEEVTTDGADYVARLTLRSLQYYAAVEKKFDELGGTLDEAATAEAAKTTLEKYQLNSKKADACLKLIYGENGSSPVTEQEYADYINNDCYYLELVQLPLFDQSTYTFASDDQKAEIEALANQCRDDLAAATSESALYSAAMTYVPQAFTALGSSVEATQALYYTGSGLFTPSDLSSYNTNDGGNSITDAVKAAGTGNWTVADLGMSYMIVRSLDPMEQGTVDDFVSRYNLLDAMKSDALQDEFYAEGAEMENNLSASVMKTYSASKIKKTVK